MSTAVELGLHAAAWLWSNVAPYGAVVRFVVPAGAMVAMFQAFHLVDS